MMESFTRIWRASVVNLLFLVFFINISHGIDYDDYSVVYRWDKYDCDYEIIKMTQYEKRLIVWDGMDFNVWCNLAFRGDNPSNVATSFRTCFRMLNYKITDCDTKFEYDAGYFTDTGDRTFSCNDEIPEVYCADEILEFKIYPKRTTSSYARLEIYVEAGVNLSIAACLGIVAGIFAAIIIVGIVIIWKCRRGKITEGQVISTDQNSSTPNASGQVLMGYPTTMEVMQPCGRGRYRPQNVTVQQSIQMPSVAQQTTQTQQPSQVTVSPQGVTYTPSAPPMS